MNSYLSQLGWIENQYDTMCHLVEKWAKINSWSENLPGLDKMLSTLMEDFKVLEADRQIISLPPRYSIGLKGNLIEKPSAKALSIRKRPKAPIQVLLGGHMDTVYPPTEPPVHPVRAGDKLIGPGVTDMKGGLVILLKTLEALEQSPEAESLGWEILINPDEEIGSPGSYPLFAAAAKRNQVGLIFEPSFSDGVFVNQRKGSANYTIIARGKAAHAGRDFASGHSAIYAMAHFIHKLEAINHTEGVTINVGHIEGGGVTNIIPDLSICRINVRAHKALDMIQLKEKMGEIIKDCNKREGIKMELIEETSRLPKPFDKKAQGLFEHFRNCATQLNIPFALRQSGGVTDGNILSNEGLPTFDSLGAIGGNIHTQDEYLELPSLIQRTQLTSLFLFNLAIGDIVIS